MSLNITVKNPRDEDDMVYAYREATRLSKGGKLRPGVDKPFIETDDGRTIRFYASKTGVTVRFEDYKAKWKRREKPLDI